MGKRTFFLVSWTAVLVLTVLAVGGWRWQSVDGRQQAARATLESALLEARIAVHGARVELERADYTSAAKHLSEARETLAAAQLEVNGARLTADLTNQLAIAVACIESADRMTRAMQVIAGPAIDSTPIDLERVGHRPNQLGGKS
jgi:hypothetical protein